jgi:hypothetical protein
MQFISLQLSITFWWGGQGECSKYLMLVMVMKVLVIQFSLSKLEEKKILYVYKQIFG